MNKELYDYAFSFLGVPYVYGGNSYFGLDCSSLAQKLLSFAGIDPKGDQTAHELYTIFMKDGIVLPTAEFGALAFFGTHDRVTHVAFCLDNKKMIEAYGGNSFITSEARARDIEACVDINPITRRKDLVAFILPRYDWS